MKNTKKDTAPENQAAGTSGASSASIQVLTRVLTRVYRVLIVIVLAMVLVFLAGSVWAVFFQKNPVSGNTPFESARMQGNVYTGIGALRLTTADSFLVILSISFPYTPGDRPFLEELTARNNDFRAIAAEYFRRFRADEINRMDEETLKTELLEQFNSLLRLGKIETLYFTDYLIID